MFHLAPITTGEILRNIVAVGIPVPATVAMLLIKPQTASATHYSIGNTIRGGEFIPTVVAGTNVGSRALIAFVSIDPTLNRSKMLADAQDT
jgi:hypothetical protein